jgi:hypothetical protein
MIDVRQVHESTRRPERHALLATRTGRRSIVTVITSRWLVAIFSLLPAGTMAQPSAPADSGGRAGNEQAQQPTGPSTDTYVPISGAQRVEWIVDGTIGPRSLGVGILAASWRTGFNVPQEWGKTWSGFGKRYLEREADVAISNTIEAGLGAIWAEDPRYIPSGRHGVWPRARHALKTVFLAPRSNGHLAPAWGYYAGNVFNNVIENTWLPPSATTWGQTAVRGANGFLGRAADNLWEEFWPDVRRRFKK